MIRFLTGTAINAFGLWLLTLIIPAFSMHSLGKGFWPLVGSYLLVGLVFGLVQGLVAPVIKVLAFPLYLLTFGLISFAINGALLILVAWLSGILWNGLFVIQGFTSKGLTSAALGWAVLGALVLSIVTTVLRGLLKFAR
jgi:putative membrane protein